MIEYPSNQMQVPAILKAVAKQRKVAEGEALFRTGDHVRNLFLILSGEVRLLRRSANGTETILQRSKGGFFAEASIDSEIYHCDAVAAGRVELLQFPIHAFRTALDTDIDFRAAWMAHLAREVRKLRSQCERLSMHSAAERILHYIESEGHNGVMILGQSRKAWAAELGLTHEALYRTLRRLKSEETLDIDGEKLSIIRLRSRSR